MPRHHETFFDLEEMKNHLKNLTPKEREKCKQFERLRNLVNHIPEEIGMSEFDQVIKELEDEEKRK